MTDVSSPPEYATTIFMAANMQRTSTNASERQRRPAPLLFIDVHCCSLTFAGVRWRSLSYMRLFKIDRFAQRSVTSFFAQEKSRRRSLHFNVGQFRHWTDGKERNTWLIANQI